MIQRFKFHLFVVMMFFGFALPSTAPLKFPIEEGSLEKGAKIEVKGFFSGQYLAISRASLRNTNNDNTIFRIALRFNGTMEKETYGYKEIVFSTTYDGEWENIGDVYTMGNYTPGRISILIKIEETYVVEITNGNSTWEFVTEIKTTNSSQVTELFLQRKYEYMDGTFKWAEKQEQLDKPITKHTGFSKASDQTISLTSTAPLQDLVWNDSDSTVIAGCEEELETNALYGNYNWGNVAAGAWGKLPCFHGNNDNTAVQKVARRYCDENSKYEKTDFTDCPYVLQTDAKVPVEDLADDIAVSLTVGKNISSEKANENLEKMDLLLAQNDQDAQTFSRPSQLSAETSETFRGAAVSIVTSMVGGSLDSSTFSGSTSIGFAVAEVQGIENKNVLRPTNEEDGEKEGSFSAELKAPEGTIATAVFYRSDTLFPSAETTKVKISGSPEEKKEVFRDIAKQFSNVENPARAKQDISFVATMISDINIIDETSLSLSNSKLEENVEMKFEVTDFAKGVHSQTKRKTAVHNQLACKFYNVSLQSWSEKGCETKLTYNEERGSYDVTCSCDHLTSFAVLMSMSSESNEAEEMASQILLGASLVCLVLTLIATLPIKKQRKVEHVQINMMLALSLSLSITCFFLMDLFVSADSDSEASTPCLIIAFLLNYFWLCQLFWMVVEAITMYRALVQVFGSAIDKALLKYSILGWGVPLIFPLVGLAWAKVTKYADPKTCFVRYPYGLASFYGPVVIAVLSIWIMFFFVARVIMRAMAAKAKKKGDSDMALRRRQLQSAFAVSTVLGLGWIVGFFLLMNNSNYSQINTALRWLFILLNAPQGIFIFVLYAVMNKKIRSYWISKITGGKYGESDFTSTTSVNHSQNPRVTIAQDGGNHLSPRAGRPSLTPSPGVRRSQRSPCPTQTGRLAPGPTHLASGRRSRTPSPNPQRKSRNGH